MEGVAPLLKMSEKVVQVTCGSIHTMIRTNMNRLFSCGNGGSYALGHGNREICPYFKQIEFFASDHVSFKTIACGMAHSGCVTDDGSVYLWGIVSDAAYFRDSKDKVYLKKPTRISFSVD